MLYLWGSAPCVQENNAFFNCLFLNKLPRELPILLSKAAMADKQALGSRTDSYTAHNSKLAYDVGGCGQEQEGENTIRASHGNSSCQRGSVSNGRNGDGNVIYSPYTVLPILTIPRVPSI
jgi:hypothetical protein